MHTIRSFVHLMMLTVWDFHSSCFQQRDAVHFLRQCPYSLSMCYMSATVVNSKQ